MPKDFYIIFFVAMFLIAYSPVYWQRRRLHRMAGEDLKALDREEWKAQQRREATIKLVSRLLWGSLILAAIAFEFFRTGAEDRGWSVVLLATVGLSLILWGIAAYRRDKAQAGRLGES